MISSYAKIPNIGDNTLTGPQGLLNGHIFVEEKLDGSSISFSKIEGKLYVRSKGSQLDLDNPNKMFIQGIESIKKIEHLLEPNWIYRGEYLCLSGDTKIKKSSGGRNSKFITIKELYDHQELMYVSNGKRLRKKDNEIIQNKRRNRWKSDGKPSLFSLDLNKDKIISNKLEKIYFTGLKSILEIKTRKGAMIKATKEHLVWTPFGWKSFDELKINDCVGILRSDTYQIPKRLFGVEHKKIKNLWRELKTNGCELCRLTSCLEIHHKDNNFLNNEINNLQVLCSTCHNQTQIRICNRKDQNYEFDKIVSIKSLPEEECYDIEMSGEENVANFIANDFIVHNCRPKHNALKYDRIPNNHIIIYDIDTSHEKYLLYNDKVMESTRLGFEVVPLLWEGLGYDFSLEKMKDLLQQSSLLGKVSIEGIVIKNYERLSKDNKLLVGKYVSDSFKEIHTRKKVNITKKDILLSLIESYKSEARWNKAIQHLTEEDKLTETMRDIGSIIKEIHNDIEEECIDDIKEELWLWAKPYFLKGVIQGFPELYKQRLSEKQFDK